MDESQFEPPSYSSCNGVSARCPVELTLYGDYFNLGACIFFVAAYAIVLVAQVILGWRSKAWSFVIYMGIGVSLELMGYAGRVVMSQDPWNYGAFVLQLCLLILGPTFVAASMSITFKNIVIWYGAQWSFFRPSLYPWVFVGSDFISIVIQALGGALSAAATGGDEDNQGLLDMGSDLLIAGVVFQLINMVFCGGLMLFYAWRRHRALKSGASRTSGLKTLPTRSHEMSDSTRPEEKKLRIFICALVAAYLMIVIRCIYRVPEMAMGWGSDLMQNETLFLVFDGVMVLISVLLLTIFHPFRFFPFLSSKESRK